MTPTVAPTAARWRSTIAALAACVAVWLAIAPPAESSLPSAPFTVSMDVSPDGMGNRVTVRVEGLPALTTAAAPEAFDLYVAQLQGFQTAVFLTTSGAWSPTRVSVQRGLSTSGFAPIAAGWTERRFGSMHLMIIGARPGTDPLVDPTGSSGPFPATLPCPPRRPPIPH